MALVLVLTVFALLPGCTSLPVPSKAFQSPESWSYCGAPLARAGSNYTLGTTALDEREVRQLFLNTGNGDLLEYFTDAYYFRSSAGVLAALLAVPIWAAVSSRTDFSLTNVVAVGCALLEPYIIWTVFSNPREISISNYNSRMKQKCAP